MQQGLLLYRLKKGNVRPCRLWRSSINHKQYLRHMIQLDNLCMQYQTEAQKLWQQALAASTPYTNAGLILQIHKLLNNPSAIIAALYSDFPQQAPSQAGATANGISTVCSLSNAAASPALSVRFALQQNLLEHVCFSSSTHTSHLCKLLMGVRFCCCCTGPGSASNTQPTCCKWHGSPSTGPATEAITSPGQGAHA